MKNHIDQQYTIPAQFMLTYVATKPYFCIKVLPHEPTEQEA
jgi:hypothetical protein